MTRIISVTRDRIKIKQNIRSDNMLLSNAYRDNIKRITPNIDDGICMLSSNYI